MLKFIFERIMFWGSRGGLEDFCNSTYIYILYLLSTFSRQTLICTIVWTTRFWNNLNKVGSTLPFPIDINKFFLSLSCVFLCVIIINCLYIRVAASNCGEVHWCIDWTCRQEIMKEWVRLITFSMVSDIIIDTYSHNLLLSLVLSNINTHMTL